MHFHDSLKRLTQHKDFQDWRAKNPKHYLVHGFLMIDPAVQPEWQIGYFSTEDDRMVTFAVNDDGRVTMNPPSEIFKKDAKIRELDMKNVAHDAEEAMTIANQYREKNYPGHKPIRSMILLQHIERGQVWNVTFVTQTFAVCNIKIDTKTHEVLHASLETLLAWGDAQPGNRQKG